MTLFLLGLLCASVGALTIIAMDNVPLHPSDHRLAWWVAFSLLAASSFAIIEVIMQLVKGTAL